MGVWDSVKRFFGVKSVAAPDGGGGAEDGPVGEGDEGHRGGYRGGYRDASRREPHAVVNPYGRSPVMQYGESEVRKRFLAVRGGRISPFYHPDLIPEPDDEFTQLVDRSMVLAGLLTEAELREIHRIGLEWRKHRHIFSHARIVAKMKADDAVEELRRQRREQAEARREQARLRKEQRREAVDRRRREDIIHLGDGVSGRLNDRQSQLDELRAARLPIMSTPADVALALELTMGQLRWLCFHEEASTVSHYHQFSIPKRSGGRRVLAAPMPHLARAQRWVFDTILAKLPVEEPAHGFVRGRSTVSNASPHLGADIVINLDLKDFFPSVTFPRVRGLFQSLGYSPAVATILALLTTECPRQPVRYAGQRYFAATGDRALPQGACTSPALANQVSRRLDRRLRGLAERLGFRYTRYADDLSFSAPKGKRDEISRLLGSVRTIVENEGFRLNPKKGRVQRRGGRLEVTGIVVNDKLGLPRSEVRRLRAILYNARHTGVEAQNRAGIPHFRAHLEGKLAYLAMVDRPRGMVMLEQLRSLPP